MQSLLDSGSEVSLIRQSCFERHFDKELMTDAHKYFNLSAANEQRIPCVGYAELDVEIDGLLVPRVGFLVMRDPDTMVERRKERRPVVAGCNLLKLACEALEYHHGSSIFDTCKSPSGVSEMLYSTLSMYHHGCLSPTSEDHHVSSAHVIFDEIDGGLPKDKGLVGTVKVGQNYKPLCIPANSVITVSGVTSKIAKNKTYLVEQAECCNLPAGVVVNS